MLFSTRQRVLTLALAGVFGTLLITHLPQAHAQSAGEQMIDIQLPTQSLAQSLTSLSRQTGVQVFAAGDIVAQRTAPAVSGRLTARQALDRLLSGTGLRSRATPAGDLVVQAPDDRSGHDMLPEVKVRATRGAEDPLGPVEGFVAGRSVTATKTDTPLLEVPQSISVIGREELDARGAQSVMEALRYVPGVAVDSYGLETRGTEWALIRGFDGSSNSNLKDGLQQGKSTWINFQTETYGLERIEILRGPASVTYGQVEVGGAIHRISKRPQAEAHREVEVQAGRYDRLQVAGDIGGKLDANGAVLYRLVGLKLDTDNQMKFRGSDSGHNERIYIAPSLTMNFSSDTSLTLLADYQKDVIRNFSIYIVNNNENTGLLRGDPSYLRFTQEQSSLGYQLEHRFNDRWALKQNFRYAKAALDNYFINPVRPTWSGRMYNRIARYGDNSLDQTALDTFVQGGFDLGATKHTVLLGVDWNQVRSDYEEYDAPAGTTPGLNIDAPVYGVAIPAATQLSRAESQKTRQFGVYLQDQIKFNQHWIATLGGRNDVVKTDVENRFNNDTSRPKDTAFTGRAGLTYLVGNGLAPYVSYAESFLSQNLAFDDGTPYKPTRGKQVEIGLKYQPANGNSLFTIALFELTKNNVETYDADFEPSQTGQIRSTGLELEFKTRLAAGVNFYAAYAHNDVKVTKSQDVDLGKVPLQVPRNIASAGIDYALKGALQGLSVNAGIRYTGKRYDDYENTLSSPSFTLVDLGARYDTGAWAFAANASNVFNKRYVASRAFGGYYPGAKGMFTLTAKYRF